MPKTRPIAAATSPDRRKMSTIFRAGKAVAILYAV
jgi:hypothetical protein